MNKTEQILTAIKSSAKLTDAAKESARIAGFTHGGFGAKVVINEVPAHLTCDDYSSKWFTL